MTFIERLASGIEIVHEGPPPEPHGIVQIVEVGGVSAPDFERIRELMGRSAGIPEPVLASGPSDASATEHWLASTHFDAPCGTGKAYAAYVSRLSRFVPQTARWVNVPHRWTRYRGRTRAHLNKFNRHKKRPNGRPRHR